MKVSPVKKYPFLKDLDCDNTAIATKYFLVRENINT